MQAPSRHLPLVGLLGLMVIVAAGGGIYYYQFVVSHAGLTSVPSHRLVFINATIVEASKNGHGFEITNTAYLNQSGLPGFDPSTGVNMTGLKFTNYAGDSDNSTIRAHPGDTITFYIYSKSEPAPPQVVGIQGHGFEIDSPSGSAVVGSTVLRFGEWVAITATFSTSGTYLYYCTITCSNGHTFMRGNIVVG